MHGQWGEDGELDSSDEEDDTDPLWSCGDAPDDPPQGFAYATCPTLETDQDHRDLIGRKVLIAHNLSPHERTNRRSSPAVTLEYLGFFITSSGSRL